MSKSERSPKIFASFSSFDDRHEQGKLSALCSRLQDEVRFQTGRDIPFFIDRSELKAGVQWLGSTQEALQQSNVLVALLTPSFFKSRWCRSQILDFLEKEKALHHEGLIIPILYNGNLPRIANDELGKIMARRRLLDWRNLRFEEFTSPRLKRQIEEAANWIASAVEKSETSTG